jgi:hypothetical protein
MKKGLLGLAALLLACTAHANPYGIVSITTTEHDFGCDSCDNSGTGAKLIGGYKLTRSFALEGSYLNFGKSNAGGDSLKVYGFGIGGAFHHELAPDWDFAGRLGVASMNASVDIGDGLAVVDNNAQIYAGVSFGYQLSRTTAINVSLDVSKGEFADTDVDTRMLGVGLTLSF